MMLKSGKDEVNPWDEFQGEIAAEYDQTNRSLKEMTMLISQTQADLSKLAQRNQTLTAQIQQMQPMIESVPRADIRTVYDSALDTQQRLERMRGQIEKLQNDQNSLKKYMAFLEKTRSVLDRGKSQNAQSRGSANDTVQMLINVQEAERVRLSRAMHDGPAQALSNFIIQTDIAIRLFDVDQNRAKDELTSLKNSATTTFQKVRNFIFELRPMMLDDLGLFSTIRRYKEQYSEMTGINIELSINGAEVRMATYLEVMIFRSIQELISLAGKMGQATQIKVLLTVDDDLVRISLDDNGKGYTPEELASDTFGIKSIKDRVEMLGGHAQIDSVVGQGTRITLELPMVKAEQPPAA